MGYYLLASCESELSCSPREIVPYYAKRPWLDLINVMQDVPNIQRLSNWDFKLALGKILLTNS